MSIVRYLKKLIRAVLIYEAVYLPFIAILQALTGYDFTAAYVAGGSVGIVELALSAIIKIFEVKEEKKAERISAREGLTGKE